MVSIAMSRYTNTVLLIYIRNLDDEYVRPIGRRYNAAIYAKSFTKSPVESETFISLNLNRIVNERCSPWTRARVKSHQNRNTSIFSVTILE